MNLEWKGVSVMMLLFINSSLFSQESSIALDTPTRLDPVSVGAMIVSTGDESVKTVVIKAEVLGGFHIYAYVPPQDPYIKSEIGFELPEGVKTQGEMQKPLPALYPGKEGLFIYTGKLDFKQDIKIDKSLKKGTKLTCWLYYQCCDAQMCLSPKMKEIELTL